MKSYYFSFCLFILCFSLLISCSKDENQFSQILPDTVDYSLVFEENQILSPESVSFSHDNEGNLIANIKDFTLFLQAIQNKPPEKHRFPLQIILYQEKVSSNEDVSRINKAIYACILQATGYIHRYYPYGTSPQENYPTLFTKKLEALINNTLDDRAVVNTDFADTNLKNIRNAEYLSIEELSTLNSISF